MSKANLSVTLTTQIPFDAEDPASYEKAAQSANHLVDLARALGPTKSDRKLKAQRKERDMRRIADGLSGNVGEEEPVQGQAIHATPAEESQTTDGPGADVDEPGHAGPSRGG